MTTETIEVHNIYTLYEDGEESLLSISFRPQDWGHPRWHYHFCKIEVIINGQNYINHCHVWQEVERSTVDAFQKISPALFLIGMLGITPELCGRSHLSEEDFWCDEWGQMPPYYQPPDVDD